MTQDDAVTSLAAVWCQRLVCWHLLWGVTTQGHWFITQLLFAAAMTVRTPVKQAVLSVATSQEFTQNCCDLNLCSFEPYLVEMINVLVLRRGPQNPVSVFLWHFPTYCSKAALMCLLLFSGEGFFSFCCLLYCGDLNRLLLLMIGVSQWQL